MYQSHNETQDTNTFKVSVVTIVNAKIWRKQGFTLMPCGLNIVKIHQIVAVSVVWRQPLKLSTKPRLTILYQSV